MKRSEWGFSVIEVLVAMAIVAFIAGGATMATFQVINVTKSSSDHATAIRQAQNAGYWISWDALMSENAIVDDDPETPDLLFLNWTEWGYGEEDSIYHLVTYSLQDLSDGIGKLVRNHWSSAGANEQTLVAEYIYYDPDDIDNTTQVSYQTPVLTAQITASFGEATETREYRIKHRPDF